MKRRFKHSKLPRKRKPRNQPPTPEPPKKDVALNMIADENIEPKYDSIFEEKYFGKYPKGQKPYGFTTGISFEEWSADCDKLRMIRKKMMTEEVDRLNDLVECNWIRCTETQILHSKVPGPIKDIIKSYAATEGISLYQHDFPKIYGGV